LISAVPAALAVVLGLRVRPRVEHRRGAGIASMTNLGLFLGAIAIGLLAISATTSVAHPTTSYDALGYHAPLGVYLWRDGNLGSFLDGLPSPGPLTHPAAAELWFGLLRLAAGEPAANIGQLPFAVLGSLAVYAIGARSGLRRATAITGALAFVIAPIVALQAGLQLNDLLGAALCMTAVALAVSPLPEWSLGRLALIGLTLGLTATTKLALLPAVAAIALYVGVLIVLRGGSDRGRRGTQLAIPTLVFVITVAPWWGRNVAMFGSPLYANDHALIGAGHISGDPGPKRDREFVPTPAAWPAYPLLEAHSDVSGFGALFLVGALPGLVIAAGRRRSRRTVALYAIITATSLPPWWLLTRHEPRFLLPVFGIGFAFVGHSLLAVPRRQRRVAGAVLGTAACYSALVTLDQRLLPFMREPTNRASFYDRAWFVDSVAVFLPQEALLHHTGLAPRSYTAHYPLLGPSLRRRLISIDGTVTTDSIVSLMRANGITFAYVSSAPEGLAEVAATYDSRYFVLANLTTVTDSAQGEIHRHLFRLAVGAQTPPRATVPLRSEEGQR
jgi:hypothetical protein